MAGKRSRKSEEAKEKKEAEIPEVKKGRGRPKKAAPTTGNSLPNTEGEETPTVEKSRGKSRTSPLIPATTQQIPSNAQDKKMNLDSGKRATPQKKVNKKYRLYEFKNCEGNLKCMSCKKNIQLDRTQDLELSARNHLVQCQKRERHQKSYSRKNITIVNEPNEETTAAVSKNAKEVEAEINEEEYDGAAVSQVPDYEDVSGYRKIFDINRKKDDDDFVLEVPSDEIESSQKEQSTSSLLNEKARTSQDSTAILLLPANEKPNMTDKEHRLMILHDFMKHPFIRRWQLFGITSDDATNVRTPGRHLSVQVTFRILHKKAALHNSRCDLNTRFAIFHPTLLEEEYSIMPDNEKAEHISNSVFFADEGRPERFMLPIHRHEHFALVVFGRDEYKHVDVHLFDPNFEPDRRVMITIAEAEEFAKHYYGEIKSITCERGTEEQVEPQKAGSNDSGVFLLLNATRCFVKNYVPLGSILRMKRHNPQFATEISEVREHFAEVTERIFKEFFNALMSFTPQSSTNSEECFIEENVKAPQDQEEQQIAKKSDTEISLPDHDPPHLKCNPLTMVTMAYFKKEVMYADDNIDFVINLSAIKTLNRELRNQIWISEVNWYSILRISKTDLDIEKLKLDPNVIFKKLLIIPVHEGSEKTGHFFLTVIVNPRGAFTRSEEDQEKCKILVFDSLKSVALHHLDIENVLSNWLRYTGEHANVEGQFNGKQIKMIEVTEAPKQATGSKDCGPYVCHFAEKVMQNLGEFENIGPTFDWRTIGNHVAGSNIRRKNVDDVLENASVTFREAIAEKLDLWTSNEEYSTANDEEFEEFDLDPAFDNDRHTLSPCSLSKKSSPSQSGPMSSKDAAGKFKEHSSHTFAESSRDQVIRKTGNSESTTANDEEFEVFELDPEFDNNRWFPSLSPSPSPSSLSDESSPSQLGFMSSKETARKSKEHFSHTSSQSSRDQVHRESGNPDCENSRKRKLTDHYEQESFGKLPRQTETSELPSSKNGTVKDKKKTIEAQPKIATSSNMRLRLENVNKDQSSVNAIANMLYSCHDVRDIFAVPRKYTLDMPLSRAVQSIFRGETHTARAWRDKIKDIGQGKQDICKMVDLLLTPLNQEELLYPLTFCVTPNVRCEKCRRTGPLKEVFERFNNVSMENDTTFADLIAREYREKPAAICKCGGQLWERRIISIFERYHIMVINHNLNKGTAEKFINFHSNDIVEMFEDDKSKQIVRWKLRAFAEDVNDKNYQSWLRFEDGWMCLRDYNILVTRRHEVDMSKHCVKILVFERLDFPS